MAYGNAARGNGMSAQAGVWNFDGAPASRETLDNISQTIAQYGPDGESTYFRGPIGMLYRPFHTTKESRLERQPHVFSHGRVILWDGRLDNREELIPQLREESGAEQTDLAIVTAAFQRWGTECFRRLVGDWALSIWEPTQRVLILARDYIGVRHLYYYLTGRRVTWCTHLAPLVLCGDRFTLNEEYIAGYLALYPEAHLTPYLEIHGVPPGKFVSFQDGKATIRPYWSFNPKLRIHHETDAEYEEHFRQVFRQSVRRRLRSDAPILADLSGGLDSSSIVCMADEILAKEGVESPRVHTLSFYDPREPDGDEQPYFTKVEERRGTKGHHCDAGTEDILITLHPLRFGCRPGNLGNAGRATEDFRRNLVEQHGFRVTLSGIGGDEFLGGVPNPIFQIADLFQQCRLVELAKQLMAWSLVKKRPWVHLLGQACALFLPTWVHSQMVHEAKIEPWLDRRFARRHRFAVRQLGPDTDFGFWLQSRIAFAKTVELVACQQACVPTWQGVGVEQRFPFLDRDLVEFLLAIPASQLLRPGERRSLMRRALADLLPPEILHRKTKGVSVRRIMNAVQTNWETLEKLFDPGTISLFGFVNVHEFRRCLLKAKHGDSVQLVRLMRAIALELWLRDVLRRGLIKEPWMCVKHKTELEHSPLRLPPEAQVEIQESNDSDLQGDGYRSHEQAALRSSFDEQGFGGARNDFRASQGTQSRIELATKKVERQGRMAGPVRD